MWEKVAKEMGIPWRAAEAMHWQLGEHDMAQRANAPIFHLSSSFVSVSQSASGNSPLPLSTLSNPGHLQLPTLSALPGPASVTTVLPASTTSVAPTSVLASRSRRSSNASLRRRLEAGRSGQPGRYQTHGEGRGSPSPSRDYRHTSGNDFRGEGSPAPRGDDSQMAYDSSAKRETSANREYGDGADASAKIED